MTKTPNGLDYTDPYFQEPKRKATFDNLEPALARLASDASAARRDLRAFGPPERRECHDCGNTRTLEFFTKHDVICDDCMTIADDLMAAAEDWGGDHIADTNQERTL